MCFMRIFFPNTFLFLSLTSDLNVKGMISLFQPSAFKSVNHSETLLALLQITKKNWCGNKSWVCLSYEKSSANPQLIFFFHQNRIASMKNGIWAISLAVIGSYITNVVFDLWHINPIKILDHISGEYNIALLFIIQDRTRINFKSITI